MKHYSQVLCTLSTEAIFSFLKLKSHFHFYYILLIPLWISAAEAHLYFVHCLINIMFCWSRYFHNIFHTKGTQSIWLNLPMLQFPHSHLVKMREENFLLVVKVLNMTACWKFLIFQLRQCASLVSDPAWVPHSQTE